MTVHHAPGVLEARTALVADEQYTATVRQLVERSVHRCLCTLFIVDLDPRLDPVLRVEGVLQELAAAAWRGVDARLIVGGSRTNRDILNAALLARARAQDLGIPARLGAGQPGRSEHSKLVVADDHVLLGSHNWSPGALSGEQRQDSVFVDHGALAAYCAGRFEGLWMAAQEEGFDVQG